jgi:antitoxin component YwqK of YwqJK toxin-antitoxin module
MENTKILSKQEILEQGIEFKGDVCYSGEYGQQLFNLPMEEGGESINGLVYEKYSNGNINYYSYYENGIKEGEYVTFYESGKIKSYCIMQLGQILGRHIVWYQNEKIKLYEECKYGIVISAKKFNEEGKLVSEKIEPNTFEKDLLAKYERIYEGKN